jgi:ribonucleoside-diphosphate reductase alpha chain
LETFVSKFVNMRFEPAGLTDDPDVRMAQSMMDYIFRRLALDYLDFETRAAYGIYTADERARQLETGSYQVDETDDDVDVEEELETFAQTAPIETKPVAKDVSAETSGAKPAPAQVQSSTELIEAITGQASDAPLCMSCGTKMRPAGSCYVCEGCGSTSGCS